MIDGTEYESLRSHLRSDNPVPDPMYLLGNVPGALLYVDLFLPEFVEIEECVFLKDLGVNPAGKNGLRYAQQIRDARSVSSEALRSFLDTCNWVEVAYLFCHHGCRDDEDVMLAEFLVEAWRARLADRFPTRRFEVRVIDPDQSGSVVSVGFAEVLS